MSARRRTRSSARRSTPSTGGVNCFAHWPRTVRLWVSPRPRVAARMGTSQSADARLEQGEADARLSTVERLAAALEVRLTWSPPAAGKQDPAKRPTKAPISNTLRQPRVVSIPTALFVGSDGAFSALLEEDGRALTFVWPPPTTASSPERRSPAGRPRGGCGGPVRASGASQTGAATEAMTSTPGWVRRVLSASTAKSRTVMLVKLGNAPTDWKSSEAA